MIIGINKFKRVYGVDEHMPEIEAFLQGAVSCWCNIPKKQRIWFTARDFLGHDNRLWHDTPLMYLYRYYLNGDDANSAYAEEEAGKAAGRILKKILIEDKREFETREGFVREYRWTGNVDASKDRTAR